MLKKVLFLALGLALFISICVINATCINTNQLRARQESIETDKLQENSPDILIAFFSDLHYGTFIDNDFLDKTINKINDYSPDIILFGGDLIDNYIINGINDEDKDYLIASLKSLNAKYGKYAVYGNHDADATWSCSDIAEILIAADFKVLDNSNATININGNNVNLVGINSIIFDNDALNNAFRGIDQNDYTFVFTHYPDMFDYISDQSFDYMLSGHSHGGQLYIPIISLFNKELGCQEYFKGKTTKYDKTLDITSGVGRTRYNARLLADAEVVMYRLSPISK